VVVKWLREHVSAAVIVTLFRFYLGYTWLTAGWHKITGGFDATGFLKGALAQASGEHPAVQSWWASFIENVALPNVGLFNVLIPWGEILVGIALLLGIFTTFAALMGAVMNFAFMFSGTTSINPKMSADAVIVKE
jgi:thiosulfate dehydrogenase [quinone] large subunit